MARLDRSPSAKEIAQIAATIGRRFSHELLRRVSGYRDHQLRGALGQLLDAELIYREGSATLTSYEFKHFSLCRRCVCIAADDCTRRLQSARIAG